MAQQKKETQMDKLLSSTIWPLGAVFLSLIKHTPCTSLPSIDTTTTTTKPELDGSPISLLPSDRTQRNTRVSDSDQGRLLDHSLSIPDEPTSTANYQRLSDRLSSPTSPPGYENHPYSSNRDSERWVQTFQKTSSHSSLYTGPPGPQHHLANRFDPAPKDFITSSNRTECNTRAWRSWGPKPPPHSDHVHHHQPDSRGSNKRSRLHDHSDYPPDPSPKKTNDFKNRGSRTLENREKIHVGKFEDDQHKKKKKYKINPNDWDWNHWTNAANLQSEKKPPATNLHSSQVSESVDNCSSSWGTSTSAAEWKKKAIEVGKDKVKCSKSSHPTPDVHPGYHPKRQKISTMFDRRDRSIGRHTTRSVSPAVSSSHAGSNVGRLPNESVRNYYKLASLHPALKDSIKRAVYSWINQLLVECFWKVGIWFEDSKKWKSDQWGSIRADQLEQLADLQYPKGISWILRTCKTDRFIDLTIKPIHSGIFTLHKDPQTNTDYLRLTKDYTPIGLLYRPIIKTLRRLHAATGTPRINIEKFVRQHLLKSSEEEDLIYLFRNDDDPYGCIKRAARDGIIEIFDDPHPSHGFTSSMATRTEFPALHPPSHANHKRKRVPFDEKYVSLKTHWLTNKEPTDIPSIYSPTISQGGSSGMPQTEEESSKRDVRERNQTESEVNNDTSTGSKTSSTNTDGSDHLDTSNLVAHKDYPEPSQNHTQKSSSNLHQHIVFGKNQHQNNHHHVNLNASSSTNDDEAIIDAIISQFKKDISSFY